VKSLVAAMVNVGGVLYAVGSGFESPRRLSSHSKNASPFRSRVVRVTSNVTRIVRACVGDAIFSGPRARRGGIDDLPSGALYVFIPEWIR
jgi:hypothetical protein